jgi:hypothetical protein
MAYSNNYEARGKSATTITINVRISGENAMTAVAQENQEI